MRSHAAKTQANKGQSMVAEVSQRQRSGEPTFQFVDNRPEAIAQRKLQEVADNSPSARQVVQRVIEITGDRVYRAGETEALKAKSKDEWEDILGATSEFGKPPKRSRTRWRTSGITSRWRSGTKSLIMGCPGVPELKPVEETAKGGGKTREAGDTPVLVLRPETQFEELRISGSIMCVGIVVEAVGGDDKYQGRRRGNICDPPLHGNRQRVNECQDQRDRPELS